MKRVRPGRGISPRVLYNEADVVTSARPRVKKVDNKIKVITKQQKQHTPKNNHHEGR